MLNAEAEDKYQLKGYKATELMNEFPNKWWIKVALTSC